MCDLYQIIYNAYLHAGVALGDDNNQVYVIHQPDITIFSQKAQRITANLTQVPNVNTKAFKAFALEQLYLSSGQHLAKAGLSYKRFASLANSPDFTLEKLQQLCEHVSHIYVLIGFLHNGMMKCYTIQHQFISGQSRDFDNAEAKKRLIEHQEYVASCLQSIEELTAEVLNTFFSE